MRLAPGKAFEPDQRQHLLDPRRDLGLGKPFLLESECDVALDREVRKQCVALKHHVDGPPIGRHGRDIGSVEEDAPLIRRLEAGEKT